MHVTGCDWSRKYVDLVSVLIEVTLKYLEPKTEQNVALDVYQPTIRNLELPGEVN